MAEVMLTNVTKQFGDFATADDITMKLEAGRFTVHVGPFGCRKTTPLRMIADLERMSDGKAKIGDRAVNRAPLQHRGLAMVFQNYALYPHMDVFTNMAFGL